uniref:ribosomal protein L5 n=1 Tax=Microzonia abyssicola TaxID=217214 RepID=UPI002E78CC31|nr:ribosomal protein L5 [Syringoderma abyssicola]WBP70368.1 ribosomal protein L5 [Syringoderma abyssicola]
MFFLKTHYEEVVQKDNILTDVVSTTARLTKPTKIMLSIGGDKVDENSVMSSLFALDFIGNQKPYLTRNKTYGSNEVVGGKLTLRGFSMYAFMYKLLFDVLPRMKQFEGFKPPAHSGTFSFVIKNVLAFEGLGPLFFYFEDVESLQCQFHFTTKDKDEVLMLGRGLFICFSTS